MLRSEVACITYLFTIYLFIYSDLPVEKSDLDFIIGECCFRFDQWRKLFEIFRKYVRIISPAEIKTINLIKNDIKRVGNCRLGSWVSKLHSSQVLRIPKD